MRWFLSSELLLWCEGLCERRCLLKTREEDRFDLHRILSKFDEEQVDSGDDPQVEFPQGVKGDETKEVPRELFE